MARRMDERRVAEWRERFERFREAGLSVVRFCERERVSAATFYLWRKRLGENAAPRSAVALSTGPFASVRLVGGATLSAWLPSGTRLEIPLHDPQALELALRVLTSVDAERRDAGQSPLLRTGVR